MLTDIYAKMGLAVRQLAVRAIAAWAVMPACTTLALADAPCRIFVPEKLRTPEVIRQAEQVSAVLSDLAKRRERFLASGDLIEIFPTIYYYTTQAQFREALNNDPDVAATMLGLIVTFYDAYLANRFAFEKGGAKAVEPHWKRFYERAVEENRAKKTSTLTVFAISLYAVDAHLIDLARSIRFTLDRTSVTREKLRAAYYKTDPVFYDAGKSAMADLSKVQNLEERYVSIERRLGLGARYVITARSNSWQEAAGDGPLRAVAPQPVLPRGPGSTEFFTFAESEACTKPK